MNEVKRALSPGMALIECWYSLKDEFHPGLLLPSFLDFLSFAPSGNSKRWRWWFFLLSSCSLNSVHSQVALYSSWTGKRTAQVKTLFEAKHTVYIYNDGYGLKKNFVADNDREGMIGEELGGERRNVIEIIWPFFFQWSSMDSKSFSSGLEWFLLQNWWVTHRQSQIQRNCLN